MEKALDCFFVTGQGCESAKKASCQLMLQMESESEKRERLHLVAALYELEKEVDVTVSAIDSLQTETLESVQTLLVDVQNFQVCVWISSSGLCFWFSISATGTFVCEDVRLSFLILSLISSSLSSLLETSNKF